MGQLDQFAKATFATDTPQITGGACVWEGPREVGLTEVHLDGLLVIKHPDRLMKLPHPWRDAARHAEVAVEIKMPGDHHHGLAVRRAELRRAAWHVKRMEIEPGGEDWAGGVGLWCIAPHVPEALRRQRSLHPAAEGCYAVDYPGSSFLWIAANELPLDDTLLPFLIARSGKALEKFARWAAYRRSPDWTLSMLRWLTMDGALKWEIYNDIEAPEVPPALREQRRWLARLLLRDEPEVREETVREERAAEARRMLRRLLARRDFTLTPEQEARIDECVDTSTLERWAEQTIGAASAGEALT